MRWFYFMVTGFLIYMGVFFENAVCLVKQQYMYYQTFLELLYVWLWLLKRQLQIFNISTMSPTKFFTIVVCCSWVASNSHSRSTNGIYLYLIFKLSWSIERIGILIWTLCSDPGFNSYITPPPLSNYSSLSKSTELHTCKNWASFLVVHLLLPIRIDFFSRTCS